MTNQGSGGELVNFFRDACAKSGTLFTPNVRANEIFMEIRGANTDAQIKWAIRQYLDTTAYPSVMDFKNYLEGIKELPDTVVCAAYLSERPMLIKLADELETLKAAWFQSSDHEAKIEALEERLKAALT